MTDNYSNKVRRFALIPYDDVVWTRSQEPSVRQLWLECWYYDQFGKQAKMLHSKLSRNSFQKAKKVLEEAGLFKFSPIKEFCRQTKREKTAWKVENLHGYYYQREEQRKACGSRAYYRKFLESEYWKQVRSAVISRDEVCQKCGGSQCLQAHHLTYEHHKDEMNHLDDLITLCRTCHYQEHFF
ncbi:MAG: HNH endonuclease [Nostoc sp. EkiNYC01]|nr:HNH endonuclease signature motif containing protein [Nostoc sp. EkiNYC01]